MQLSLINARKRIIKCGNIPNAMYYCCNNSYSNTFMFTKLYMDSTVVCDNRNNLLYCSDGYPFAKTYLFVQANEKDNAIISWYLSLFSSSSSPAVEHLSADYSNVTGYHYCMENVNVRKRELYGRACNYESSWNVNISGLTYLFDWSTIP